MRIVIELTSLLSPTYLMNDQSKCRSHSHGHGHSISINQSINFAMLHATILMVVCMPYNAAVQC